MDKFFLRENPKLVKVKDFIYPKYNEEIERELKENGITEVYSYGRVNLGKGNVIGKGKTGIIALLDHNKVIKIRRSDSPKEDMEIEARIQSLACPVAPRVYHFGKNFIVMEYIKGVNLDEKRIDLNIILNLLIKAKELEERNIEHKELSRPYKNVMISNEGKVYIIDYDSASIKEKPLNVTSILSWLRLNDLASQYKKTRRLDEIIETLKSQILV